VLSITAATGQAIALAVTSVMMSKDAELIIDALREAGDDPLLMRAVHHLMSAAADAGHEGEDMAAVVHAFR
jgi:3-hydroxyisobutyrate dehydrogenase-like beta-hydroxyacid dehydrogenase